MIAALTAQNTRAVSGVHTPPVDFLKRQIDTLFEDVRIDSVKLGMLGTADIIAHRGRPSGPFKPAHGARPGDGRESGDHLLAKSAVAMLKEALMPQANMITPNLPEAGVLLEQRAPSRSRRCSALPSACASCCRHRASAGCCSGRSPAGQRVARPALRR